MMMLPKYICWDACVFIRHITQVPNDKIEDIARFVADARRGLCTIYYSSINIAEVTPNRLKLGSHGTFQQFVNDMGKAFVGIDPNPNIMMTAALLKDAKPTNPEPKEETGRVIGTGDAIHLATCLWLRDVAEIPDLVFHTFDKGKGKNWEGRCVPLIGMERWYPASTRPKIISDVCSVPRSEPVHPQPDLLAGVKDDWNSLPSTSH